MNPKLRKISAIIVGIVLSFILLIVGFKVIQSVFIKAADVEPRDVIVSDIGKNSAKVTWSTGEDSQAVIEYGTTPTALNFFSPEAESTKSHSVDLTLLTPNSTYYFQMRIGETKYDNGGVPWTFSTKSSDDSVQSVPTVTPIKTITEPESTPVQSVIIPNATDTCSETDCQKIKSKLGSGCSTQDYFKCVKKLTPTP